MRPVPVLAPEDFLLAAYLWGGGALARPAEISLMPEGRTEGAGSSLTLTLEWRAGTECDAGDPEWRRDGAPVIWPALVGPWELQVVTCGSGAGDPGEVEVIGLDPGGTLVTLPGADNINPRRLRAPGSGGLLLIEL
ncbi:hypothetical protein NDU88_004242 [Pleurodeles waltl]|uniref:Uncharacterized protein n=1 Tax=Pleurodeles waltl TaxID=8319 RepID=A0AAV7UGK1_PLEWA|nr:hypothetical protein NDU88_004242 [Pleurodeles waltl]